MLPELVLRITQPKALDPILFFAQSHELVLGIIAENALNRIASRLWDVNKQKTFLKRNHQRACGIILGRATQLGEYWQLFISRATCCWGKR
jgi:hypothetical protein